ncbi:PAS domain-containing protein [Aureimonas sp. AU22]|uniref:PAS domain-containing protein n=1 Tax=Aureimonas sp. AU22 TaxID=1638162 RepID=UPI0007855FB2|nr:PAS domain-containing protein [Aureimonas sp. AU22]
MDDRRVKNLRPADELIGIWTSDKVNNLVIADQRVCEYFNVDPNHGQSGVPLRTFLDAVHPDDLPELTRRSAQAIASGEAFQASYRVISVIHGLRQVHASGQCFLNRAGDCTHLSGYLLSGDASTGAASGPTGLLSEVIENLMQARDLADDAGESLLRRLIEAVLLEAGFRLAAHMRSDGTSDGGRDDA